MPKVEIPAEIEKQMKLWHLGAIGLPDEFVKFHEELAGRHLSYLRGYAGFTIHNSFMASDGWGDGMRTLVAIVESLGELMKLQWHPGNQEFFVQTNSGASPLRLRPPL